MKRLQVFLVLALHAVSSGVPAQENSESLIVGSKNFTEGYLLAEILAQTLTHAGFDVHRQFGFGGTLVAYEALVNGEIDLYPEYTGTIAEVILDGAASTDLEQLNRQLSSRGVQALAPLGFNNTYALVVRPEMASRLGLRTISDLKTHETLRLALSHEFRNRRDGWPALAAHYGLTTRDTGIEHGLAYQALVEGKIDVTDAYSTDGELERYDLLMLEDDKHFFPSYLAVPLVSSSLPAAARSALARLEGTLDEEAMRALNGRVVTAGESFGRVAADFLRAAGITAGESGFADAASLWTSLGRNTATHLKLTTIALLLACGLGVPAAILVYRSKRLSNIVLYFAGLMQTIPSIALLALMIPLMGVGQIPAIVALFLYSLLPILRNTITAFLTIDPLYKRVADAMGLTKRQQIRHVLFPLALPHVLAGIKTAAVISIGTATLAAFIGAGGLGEPIVTGLALNDTGLILQGAIPAAILAIATELLFELLERRLVPAHMLQA